MEGSRKPHLIAYRKDSSNRVFKFENKDIKTSENKKSEDTKIRPRYREPERRRCDCGANDHPLFSNCMGCGRLVCNMEKEGPCLDCGVYVHPVDSDKIPSEHLDNPEFKIAVMLRNKLLSCDKDYQSSDFKIHDLHSGWFEESRDIYNEKSELAKLEWLREECEKREQEVQKYDLDLFTGRLSVSHSDTNRQ